MVNFQEEKKWWKQGYEFVAGLDEVGRGSLAGPVVAAAVCIRQFQISNFKFQINDSKKLSTGKREEIHEIIINHPDILWGIGVVSEKIIDKVNILQATKLAMKTAAENLPIPADFLLLDGNFLLDTDISQKAIIKGDQKVFSIAAASIIAKVTRDRLMQKMHKKYPQYGFANHKGYGTVLHLKNLAAFGPAVIHRKTFFPISKMV